MNILVTGAGGFLGRHTVRLLRAHGGYEVVTVSRSRAFDDDTLLLDLADPERVAALPRNLECIVHLAARVPPKESDADLDVSFRNNVQSTQNLLEFAARHGIPSFVLGSSCAVYGESAAQLPVREGHEKRPANFYALSKLAAEVIAGPYAFYHGMNIKTLRFSYIYGAGMRRDTVVERFCRLAFRNEAIPLHNEGRDQTDLLYVRDAAEAVCAAISRGRGACNISSGVGTSIRALAETIVALTDSSSELVFQPARNDEKRIFLSIDRAERELGWKPAHDLRSGLLEFLNERGPPA